MAATRSFFLRGEFFRIVLKDVTPKPKEESTPPVKGSNASPQRSTGPVPPGVTPSQASGPPEYFIHKTLLSSLSLELYNHANNNMKEGQGNVIQLSEVDEPTLEAFLEWAYYKDYYNTDSTPQGSSLLSDHTKVYVLADRFNIAPLKDLAFSKISALLAGLGMVSERSDILAMISAVTYAYDNLPGGSGSSTAGGAIVPLPSERLLRYFAQYISWALEIFRYNDEFMKMLVENPDFAEALIVSCRPAATPPWILDAISGTGSGSSYSASEKTITSAPSTDKSHLLHRKCGSCSYVGVMSVQCASCSYFDDEVGTAVKLQGSDLGVAGADRLSGTKSNFTYKCKWCQASNTYGTTARTFTHPYFGSSFSSQLCLGYLTCRKCHAEGYRGNITIVP